MQRSDLTPTLFKQVDARMKIYVAGINLKDIDSDLQGKIKCIIGLIDEIKKDAVASLGDDAMVMIVLHECALTRRAIPNKEKKNCLETLESAMKKFKNMILIPGSFVAYEKLIESSDPEKKKNKILENYNSHLPHVTYDDVFFRNYHNAVERLASLSAMESIILQNSSYIISSDEVKKVKHKKILPWNEEDMLSDKKNYLFYSGESKFTENTFVNGSMLDIRLIICADYYFDNCESIKNKPSTFEVIVSDSVDVDDAFLLGAVNIHMDSDTGLTVYINNDHPKTPLFDKVKAFCYYPDSNIKANNENNCKKSESTISYFNTSFTVEQGYRA